VGEPVWITLIDVAHLAFRARRDFGFYVRIRLRPRAVDRKLIAMLEQPRRDWRNGERGLHALAARYAFELSRIPSIGPDRLPFALLMARTFLAWNDDDATADAPERMAPLAIPVRIPKGPSTQDFTDICLLLNDWSGPTW
jgi:hypothetical protein